MQNISLFIVDPQIDFCDPKGALSVPGADKDMQRLSSLINKIGGRIDTIYCTLDTHHIFDIAHPLFWIDAKGNHPEPFVIITKDDLINKRWQTTRKQDTEYALEYVSKLADNNRYPLCIWPPHCLIGTNGHRIFPTLSDALLQWEINNIKMVNYIIKGANYKTEHYSAIQADVPDIDDISTHLNNKLISELEKADTIVVAGEALSHCMKFTVEDLVANMDKESIKNIKILKDCTSCVPNFEDNGVEFMENMREYGIQFIDSTDHGNQIMSNSL